MIKAVQGKMKPVQEIVKEEMTSELKLTEADQEEMRYISEKCTNRGQSAEKDRFKYEVQIKIIDIEEGLSNLEIKTNNFPANSEFIYSKRRVKPLIFDSQNSLTAQPPF
ncbi:hypothetical protein NPIL_50751 [Nephila pilipes]|uniref:Uncharacterized protein n=1 Tax=Nephila pilipes TaxID=299642 RepID=A0A8X6P804_NEPPI|nr:hypothetical protein NPIL_50751 [Nephila pilipes]